VLVAAALAYILAIRWPGLRQSKYRTGVNANYLRKRLERYYDLPYTSPDARSGVRRTSARPNWDAHRRYQKRLID